MNHLQTISNILSTQAGGKLILDDPLTVDCQPSFTVFGAWYGPDGVYLLDGAGDWHGPLQEAQMNAGSIIDALCDYLQNAICGAA